MALSLTLNAAHSRLKRPRLGVFAQGMFPSGDGGPQVSGWSRQLFDNVYQEPVGGNLMLLPYCLREEWVSTFTGSYARKSFADFGLTAGSGGWRYETDQAMMAHDGDMDSPVQAVSAYGGDRGVFFGFAASTTGKGNFSLFDIGFGPTTVESADLALRFMSGGTVQVWHGGEIVEEGSCGAQEAIYNEFMILPMNVRELLVLSLTTRQGFIAVFADIQESDATPRMIPEASKFWFYRDSGLVIVEVAPLLFATSGTVYSTKLCFAEMPGTSGETTEGAEVFGRVEQGGTVTPSLSNVAATGAYSPSDGDLKCRLKVALTGPGGTTPFVQGAVAGYQAISDETDGSGAFEVRDRAMGVRLSVPESATDVRLSFSCLGREVGADDALWDLCRLTNLPLDAAIGELVPFFRGQSGPAPQRYEATDGARHLSAEFRDEWGLMENSRYRDPYPFDALTLSDALTRVAGHMGLFDADIETNSFQIPFAESPALGDWAEIAKAGDTMADEFRRLIETYAATWGYGWFPTVSGRKLRAGALGTHFGSTPVLTLYPTIQEAVDAGYSEDPNDADAAWRFVYREFEETRLRVEANDIRVTGFDPKTGRPIQARYFDAASADPSAAPEDRPDNWEGEWLPYALFDPRITTQAACERAAGILAGRLSRRRVTCSFGADLLRHPAGQPIWRGDVIELAGQGVYRINTLEAEWVISEPDATNPRRRCRARFTAVKGAGSALGTESLEPGLSHVKRAHERSTANRTRVRPGADFLLGRPVSVQTTASLLTA